MGVCEKCRNSGPTPGVLNGILTKFPGDFEYTPCPSSGSCLLPGSYRFCPGYCCCHREAASPQLPLSQCGRQPWTGEGLRKGAGPCWAEAWRTAPRLGRVASCSLRSSLPCSGSSRGLPCTSERRPRLQTSQSEGRPSLTLAPDVAKEAAHQEGWEWTWPAKGTEWLQGKATGWQEVVSPGARCSLGGEPWLASHP